MHGGFALSCTLCFFLLLWFIREYAGRINPLFTDEALRCIYDYSSGLPRLINRACTQALGFAFQNGNSIVDDHIVKIVLTTELNTVA